MNENLKHITGSASQFCLLPDLLLEPLQLLGNDLKRVQAFTTNAWNVGQLVLAAHFSACLHLIKTPGKHADAQ